MNTVVKYSQSTASTAQSLQLGRDLSALLRLGDVVEFVGDLGGGKTTMIKGIAQGLGITQTVTSPTYNIQRSYRIPDGGTLEHYDLYRLGDDEILLSEMREVIEFGQSIICVEWANHFGEHLLSDRFVVRIRHIDEDRREIDIQATGETASHRLQSLINNQTGGAA